MHPRVVFSPDFWLPSNGSKSAPARHKVVIPIGSMTVLRRLRKEKETTSPFHGAIRVCVADGRDFSWPPFLLLVAKRKMQ